MELDERGGRLGGGPRSVLSIAQSARAEMPVEKLGGLLQDKVRRSRRRASSTIRRRSPEISIRVKQVARLFHVLSENFATYSATSDQVPSLPSCLEIDALPKSGVQFDLQRIHLFPDIAQLVFGGRDRFLDLVRRFG